MSSSDSIVHISYILPTDALTAEIGLPKGEYNGVRSNNLHWTWHPPKCHNPIIQIRITQLFF